jgi:hypothetical protein
MPSIRSYPATVVAIVIAIAIAVPTILTPTNVLIGLLGGVVVIAVGVLVDSNRAQ